MYFINFVPDSLTNSGSVSLTSLSPLLGQVTSALNDASTTLNSLEGTVDASTGGTKQDVAKAIAGVVSVGLLKNQMGF